MSDAIKVSVIIPVYNASRYIDECLDSVLGQNLQDLEVICIDDCSIDDSLVKIEAMQKRDGRIRIFQNERNMGAGPSRNKGLEEANGDFIAFMDPDDLYPHKDCLSRLYDAALDNQCDVVGGNLVEFFYDDVSFAKDWGKGTFLQNEKKTYADYPFSVGYTRFIYRKSKIDELGVVFPAYRRYQDPVWFASVMVKVKDFYAINYPVYSYRQNENHVRWTIEKADAVLKGKVENLILFRDHGYEDHYKREVRELNNFIAMILYKTIFNADFTGVFCLISKFNKNNYPIVYNWKNTIHFSNYGAMLFRNFVKKTVASLVHEKHS